MEKRKKKNIKCPKLGAHAEKLLLITLPIVLIQAVFTTVFVAGKDTYEIAMNIDTISLMLDRIGLSLLLSILGSLVFRHARKKREEGLSVRCPRERSSAFEQIRRAFPLSDD